MAGAVRLDLSGTHRAALADFRRVIEELLVRDWSALVMGGGTVLAMHWHHRHSTDLDFVVEEDEPLDARALRSRLETLQRQGRIDVWLSIARSRKGRRTGRPVLRPSDPELARDVWGTCARMLEVATGK